MPGPQFNQFNPNQQHQHPHQQQQQQQHGGGNPNNPALPIVRGGWGEGTGLRGGWGRFIGLKGGQPAGTEETGTSKPSNTNIVQSDNRLAVTAASVTNNPTTQAGIIPPIMLSNTSCTPVTISHSNAPKATPQESSSSLLSSVLTSTTSLKPMSNVSAVLTTATTSAPCSVTSSTTSGAAVMEHQNVLLKKLLSSNASSSGMTSSAPVTTSAAAASASSATATAVPSSLEAQLDQPTIDDKFRKIPFSSLSSLASKIPHPNVITTAASVTKETFQQQQPRPQQQASAVVSQAFVVGLGLVVGLALAFAGMRTGLVAYSAAATNLVTD
jgi:hypothetical protein